MLKLLRLIAWMGLSCLSLFCQTPVDLGNGFKPWGSYNGGTLDSVSLESGGLLLHAPIIPKYPQRGGGLAPEIRLYLSSHNWRSTCMAKDPTTGTPTGCSWQFGSTGIWFEYLGGTSVQRIVESTSDPQFGVSYSLGGGYALSTWDGASHQLFDLSNGALTNFVTMDGTGYQLATSNPDQYGIAQTGIVTDRKGEQHVASFGGGRCTFPVYFAPRPSGHFARVYDNWEASPTECTEHSLLQQIVDPNGNVMSLQAPLISLNPPQDTMGRPSWPLQGGTTSDSSGCINTLPFAQSVIYTFPSLNGVQNQIKVCMGTPTLQTFFGLPGIIEFQNTPVAAQPPIPITTSIILPDGTSWVFSYDSYGNVTSIQLPTGGSVSYVWSTLIPGITNPCTMPNPGAGPMPAARVISQRTVVDNNGNSTTWTYHWGGLAQDGSMTNWVTDPNGNDTVHVFKSVASSQCTGGPGAGFHETQTKYFSGLKDTGALLKQVDTSYARATMLSTPSGEMSEANIFPTDILTTVHPSGKVNLVHTDYDSAFGVNGPSLGAVTAEKVYDWGASAPGPLLRETDTTYQWQINGGYLTTAHLLDIPATVVVKDGNGCSLAQTDYKYDEVEPTALGITSQHIALPVGSLRGNLTSVTRRVFSGCNPAAYTAATAATRWLDTGEVLSSTDPGGHVTTHVYNSAYQGAYVTQSCAPATGGGSTPHCVSGTYDFNTGLLTNFTNENATQQANGTTPGDANHTISYNYDPLTFRLLSAIFPPDPGNSGVQAQTNFVYSAPGVFPIKEEIQRPVTPAYTDHLTTTYDGLGRPFKTEHAMPSGAPSTIITTYDDLNHNVSVTNPFFATSDSTYGSTTTHSDPIGRPTTITEQDGSIRTVSYNVVALNSLGDCTITTDEAGNQRRSCSDALGRLVEVDEPNAGVTGGISHGSITVAGAPHAPVTIGAQGAVAATGSVTISGAEQSKSVVSQAAISGAATIRIAGTDASIQTCGGTPTHQICVTTYDTGSLTVTVNVGGTLISQSAGYQQGTLPAALANGLQQAFAANNSATFAVSYIAGADNFTLVARAAGASTNYPVSYSINSGQGASGYSFSTAPAAFSGGANTVFVNRNDSGNVTINVNGHPDSVSYGSGDTTSTIASRLSGQINADAASYVTASVSGPTISLFTIARGASADYPVSCPVGYDSADFSSSSFTATCATLTGGVTGSAGTTFNESGVVTMAVGSFTASAPYGPASNNTAAAVAAALAGTGSTGLNRQGTPISASVSGATITISYLTMTESGNVGVSVSSSVDPSVAAYFSGSTFTGSTSLTGGTKPEPSDLTSPYVTLYSYDALGNLLNVTQKGDPTLTSASQWRVRHFTYDSLSRAADRTQSGIRDHHLLV